MGLKIQPNYAVNPKNLKDVIYKQLYSLFDLPNALQAIAFFIHENFKFH